MDDPDLLDERCAHVLEAARRFSDHFDAGDDRWVARLTASLACLYAAACDLPELPLDADATDPPAPDPTRLSRARRVAETHLGEAAAYRQFFIPTDLERDPVQANLVDDVIEVLGAVLPMLEAEGSAIESALWDCKYEGFPILWGPRAAHALAALHGLAH